MNQTFGAIAATVTSIIAGVLLFIAAQQPNPTHSTIASIQNAEATYLAGHGTYFQVQQNNTIPPRENDTVINALGKFLPPTMQIDTYQTPEGVQGYTITFNEASGTARVSSTPDGPTDFTPALVSSTSTTP